LPRPLVLITEKIIWMYNHPQEASAYWGLDKKTAEGLLMPSAVYLSVLLVDAVAA